MTLIISYQCYECGFEGDVESPNRKIKCPSCGVINDFWLEGEIPPKNHRKDVEQMPCTPFKSSDGSVVGIMCSRTRQKQDKCYVCDKPATKLCDHAEQGSTKTCDKPMCNKHAHSVGLDKDLCKEHYDEFKTREAEL